MMKSRYLFITLALMMVCLPSIAVFAPTASAADIALTRYGGAQFDLYVPESIQNNDIIILVNYADDSDLTLLITGYQYTLDRNKTYLTYTLAERSSELIQVAFPDVETNYTIALIAGGNTIFSIGRDIGGFYLPPPKDSWTWTPPETLQEEKIFTASDWARLIASITLDTLLIPTVIATIGVFLGAGIKVFTRFLAPTDLISIGFFVFLGIDGVFNVLGTSFNKLWYLPLVIGYILGFFIWHIPYVMPVKIDSAAKMLDIRPVVLYYPDERNKPCIQEQTNRALIRRWLGIHHELTADGGLNPDWHYSVKKPYFPTLRGPGLWLQKTKTDESRVPLWRFNLIKRQTAYILANASRMPYYLWLMSSDSFHTLTSRLETSENMRVKDNLMRRAETTAAASDMLRHSMKVSMHESIADWFSEAMEDNEPIQLKEHELTTAEDSATDQQQESFEESEEEMQEEQPEIEPEKPKRGRKPQTKQVKGRKKTDNTED
jgi:hypothetical protein